MACSSAVCARWQTSEPSQQRRPRTGPPPWRGVHPFATAHPERTLDAAQGRSQLAARPQYPMLPVRPAAVVVNATSPPNGARSPWGQAICTAVPMGLISAPCSPVWPYFQECRRSSRRSRSTFFGKAPTHPAPRQPMVLPPLEPASDFAQAPEFRTLVSELSMRVSQTFAFLADDGGDALCPTLRMGTCCDPPILGLGAGVPG